jgi:molecular chaperone GrpE (heat shock protein)
MQDGEDDPDPWPGPIDERQLFNDLLAQAIYCPDGDVAVVAERLREFRDSDHLCLIYADPVTDVRVPIFLWRQDWQDLASVAPQRLNQAGLTIARPTANLVEQIEQQVLDVIRERSIGLDPYAEELRQQLSQVIDQSLGRRERELAAEREKREEDLNQKTVEQARYLDGLYDEWNRVKAALEQAETVLRGAAHERLLGRTGGKIGAAQKLLAQLDQRARDIERIAAEGAQNWVTFVERVVEVATQLEKDASEQLDEAGRAIESADERLQLKHHNVIQALRPRIDALHASLRDVGARFGRQTDDLSRTLGLLVQANAALSGTTLTASRLNIGEESVGQVKSDLVAARHEIEQLRQRLRDRDGEVAQREREVSREMTILRQQAAEATSQREQQRRSAEETGKREAQLRDQVQQLNQEVRSLKSQVRALQSDVATAQAEAARQQNDAVRTAERASQQIADLRSRLEEAEQQRREAEDAVDRLDVDTLNLGRDAVRAQFNRLASIIDLLRHAAIVSPQIAEGVDQIRTQFVAFLQQEYPGAAVIPITPNHTLFDEKLGHSVVDVEHRADLPDRTITRVLGDGYTYRGIVIREARVTVNLRPDETGG